MERIIRYSITAWKLDSAVQVSDNPSGGTAIKIMETKNLQSLRGFYRT